MALTSIPDLVRQRAADHPSATILRKKDRGIWKSTSWAELAENMGRVARSLLASGFLPRDVACVLSETRPEWAFADLGILAAGGISAGLYATTGAEQTAEMVRDCGARIAFVENEEQLDKLLGARARCPALERIVVFDMKGLRDLADPDCESLADFLERGAGHQDPPPDIRPEQVAAVVYTVGTTGKPKGAMLTHRNILSQIENAVRLLDLRAGDERLAFASMGHVMERVLGFYLSLQAGVVSNFVERADTVAENLQEVQPTFFAAAPHVWERFHSRISIAAASAGFVQRLLFRWAMAAGARAVDQLLTGRSPGLLTGVEAWVLRRIVLANVLRELGLRRLRLGLIGAYPASPELLRWFMAFGLNLCEFYGQTETAGLATLMPAGAVRPGSVGKPVPHVTVALSPDDEVLVQGDCVFAGYWNRPEETGAVLRDGWLHTGDHGRLESEYLRIDGRAEDMITVASGDRISTAEIERELKLSSYIADAVILGDQRAYLSCLVLAEPDNLEGWAHQNDVAFTSFSSLVRAGPVLDLIRREIERANARLPGLVEIRSFRLIEHKLTPEDPELTPMMKLKRAVVGERYRGLIEEMYSSP